MAACDTRGRAGGLAWRHRSPSAPRAQRPRTRRSMCPRTPPRSAGDRAGAPGDTSRSRPGVSRRNVVPPAKRDITIRGADRNEVVLDGEDERKHGIEVHADGVSILNPSVHDFRLNGLYWEGADRYRASDRDHLERRRLRHLRRGWKEGVVDDSYVSGAADAAYYVGECKPCRATISNVVATRVAVGYSGTNATGVVILRLALGPQRRGDPAEHIRERGARAAIAHDDPPQHGDAKRPRACPHPHSPRRLHRDRDWGVAGGNVNTISRNRVSRSQRYGIAIFPTARFIVFAPGHPEPGPPRRPRGNRVTRNLVTGQQPRRSCPRAGLGEGQLLLAQRRGPLLAARRPDPHLRLRSAGRG